ncbi:MAG: hypothetical protein ABIV47_22395 [Roseiflexaceae bacterium]
MTVTVAVASASGGAHASGVGARARGEGRAERALAEAQPAQVRVGQKFLYTYTEPDFFPACFDVLGAPSDLSEVLWVQGAYGHADTLLNTAVTTARELGVY